MTDVKTPMHLVCTLEEASQLVSNHDSFWVCNCGCREGKGGCRRSRMDVCLTFAEDGITTGSERKQISVEQVHEIIDEACDKYLVARPFRDDETRTKIEGICFCCDDCCAYFLNPEEVCDKGQSIEKTDMDGCTLCGDCVDVCHFKARALKYDNLMIDSEKCYGCGSCVRSCPTDCIEMVART